RCRHLEFVDRFHSDLTPCFMSLFRICLKFSIIVTKYSKVSLLSVEPLVCITIKDMVMLASQLRMRNSACSWLSSRTTSGGLFVLPVMIYLMMGGRESRSMIISACFSSVTRV